MLSGSRLLGRQRAILGREHSDTAIGIFWKHLNSGFFPCPTNAAALGQEVPRAAFACEVESFRKECGFLLFGVNQVAG